MNTTKPRQPSDGDRDIKMLRDDELDAVAGGSSQDLKEATNAWGNTLLGMVKAIR
jgi:hypothetical protein